MGFFDAIGSAFSSVMSYKSQEETNKASAHEADINRQWMAEMSNTAHQREVKDLVAAGLNPVLSAGVGASTPGGSMPSLSAPGVAASRALSDAVSSFSSARLAKESIKTQQTQQAANSAQAAKLYADAVKTVVDTKATKGTLKYWLGSLQERFSRDISAHSAKGAKMWSDLSGSRQVA